MQAWVRRDVDAALLRGGELCDRCEALHNSFWSQGWTNPPNGQTRFRECGARSPSKKGVSSPKLQSGRKSQSSTSHKAQGREHGWLNEGGSVAFFWLSCGFIPSGFLRLTAIVSLVKFRRRPLNAEASQPWPNVLHRPDNAEAYPMNPPLTPIVHPPLNTKGPEQHHTRERLLISAAADGC